MPSITVSNYEATVKLHQMVRKNGNGIVRLVGQVIYYKWLVASSFGNCGNSCSQPSGNRVWEWEKKKISVLTLMRAGTRMLNSLSDPTLMTL